MMTMIMNRSYSPKDVGITVDFGGPFRLTAVAFTVVGGHDRCWVFLFLLLFGRIGWHTLSL